MHIRNNSYFSSTYRLEQAHLRKFSATLSPFLHRRILHIYSADVSRSYWKTRDRKVVFFPVVSRSKYFSSISWPRLLLPESSHVPLSVRCISHGKPRSKIRCNPRPKVLQMIITLPLKYKTCLTPPEMLRSRSAPESQSCRIPVVGSQQPWHNVLPSFAQPLNVGGR